MDEFEDTFVGGTTAAPPPNDYPAVAQGFEDDPYAAHDAANGALPTEEFFAGQAAVVDQPPSGGYDDPFGAPPTEGFDAPFGGAAPAPVVNQEPSENDPRSIWSRKNNETLLAKTAAEEQAKKEALQKAQEHMDKFYQGRKTSTTARHESNREDEQTKTTDRVPTEGTAWEKITALINFGFEVHQKDVQRYKACLVACKTSNVAVKA